MDEKIVEIIIHNRKGLGSHTETIKFHGFGHLSEYVGGLVAEVPFYKVDIELVPNWELSDVEQMMFLEIEGK